MEDFFFTASFYALVVLKYAIIAAAIWAIWKFYRVLVDIRKSLSELVEITKNKK